MSVLFTLLLVSFGGLSLLAASPFIVYKIGKKYFHKLANPYEKSIQKLQGLSNKQKLFLSELAKKNFYLQWVKENKLSIESLSLILAFSEPVKRLALIKQLPKNISQSVDEYLKSTKKIRLNSLDSVFTEIKDLLYQEIKNKNASNDAYIFYYFDELYEDIDFIYKNLNTVNQVLRYQIQQIIERTLVLLPYFDELRLIEFSHKFKTLIQKDIKESLRLFSNIDSSQQTDKETELYAVLKSIIQEIEEIEQKISNTNEDELTKRMRLMKEKFQIHLDEE